MIPNEFQIITKHRGCNRSAGSRPEVATSLNSLQLHNPRTKVSNKKNNLCDDRLLMDERMKEMKDDPMMIRWMFVGVAKFEAINSSDSRQWTFHAAFDIKEALRVVRQSNADEMMKIISNIW
ncbi:CLUMA_CG006149, isoform A [Clunio marinus]|uniref:CLUMA_CG006149, isoform A n=1 Tax=Clunio marinus TaxID=568069 RepID=A0A1J1I2I9_9DIPT|nr:CLUMA_CG006149, isoform A [Clunio marinus]